MSESVSTARHDDSGSTDIVVVQFIKCN